MSEGYKEPTQEELDGVYDLTEQLKDVFSDQTADGRHYTVPYNSGTSLIESAIKYPDAYRQALDFARQMPTGTLSGVSDVVGLAECFQTGKRGEEGFKILRVFPDLVQHYAEAAYISPRGCYPNVPVSQFATRTPDPSSFGAETCIELIRHNRRSVSTLIESFDNPQGWAVITEFGPGYLAYQHLNPNIKPLEGVRIVLISNNRPGNAGFLTWGFRISSKGIISGDTDVRTGSLTNAGPLYKVNSGVSELEIVKALTEPYKSQLELTDRLLSDEVGILDYITR